MCSWWEVRDGKQTEEDEMTVQCLVRGVKHVDLILKLMRVKKETVKLVGIWLQECG